MKKKVLTFQVVLLGPPMFVHIDVFYVKVPASVPELTSSADYVMIAHGWFILQQSNERNIAYSANLKRESGLKCEEVEESVTRSIHPCTNKSPRRQEQRWVIDC